MHGTETQDGLPAGERDWKPAARRDLTLQRLGGEEVAAAPTIPLLRRDSQANWERDVL